MMGWARSLTTCTKSNPGGGETGTGPKGHPRSCQPRRGLISTRLIPCGDYIVTIPSPNGGIPRGESGIGSPLPSLCHLGPPQRRGWRHIGSDGRTGPTVTEETRSTGPTSRRRPVRAQLGVRTPFEGFVVLFRGVWRAGRTGVCGTMSQS
jgi:hypothetical protein